MRPIRILTATALTASGVLLSAGAAAAQTTPTPNPDLFSFPTGPACADRTFTGEVRAAVNAKTLPANTRASVVVQLRWNNGGTAFEDTAVAGTQVIYPTAGPAANYAFSISTADVPASAKNLIAVAIGKAGSVTTETIQSRTLAPSFCASPAATTPTTVSSVSIDCSGDLVSGAAALANPPASGSVPGQVGVQGRPAGGAWASLGSKNYTVGNTTSLPYSISIAGKHTAEYRAFARVNNGAVVYSDVVSDATCAPPAEVPEAPAALLLPLSMAAGAGVVVAVRRRRATTATVSA